jgi:glycosyltransferase involved in cell wall biosynthesis
MRPDHVEVSVVMTTHDRGELAQRAIHTVLEQTFQDFEVIVVDDGSIVPFEFGGVDPRVSVLRLPESRGVCAARNVGLGAGKGTWVTFVDDDDELMPRMLEASIQAASTSRLPTPVCVTSAMELVMPDGSRDKVRWPVSLPKGSDYFLEEHPAGTSFTVGNTLFIQRELLTDIGGFDEELRNSVHTELMLRVNAACSIEGVREITYRLRRHGGPQIHGNALLRAQAMATTEIKHREAFARHPKGHARYLGAMGMWFLKGGAWASAIRATTRALRMDPLNGRLLMQWIASLAGPLPLSLFRRFQRRGVGGTR